MPTPDPKFLMVPEHVDDRGHLRVFELDHPLPFVPVRSFVISNVQPGKSRAGHIVTCDQVLAMLTGACQLTVKANKQEQTFRFVPENGAIYLPRGTWLLLSEFDSEAILLVFASERFDVTRDFPTRPNTWQDS